MNPQIDKLTELNTHEIKKHALRLDVHDWHLADFTRRIMRLENFAGCAGTPPKLKDEIKALNQATPRTDAFTRDAMCGGYVSHEEWKDFAHRLERELNRFSALEVELTLDLNRMFKEKEQLKAKLEKLQRRP